MANLSENINFPETFFKTSTEKPRGGRNIQSLKALTELTSF